MPAKQAKSNDYKPLSKFGKDDGENQTNPATLKPLNSAGQDQNSEIEFSAPSGLINSRRKDESLTDAEPQFIQLAADEVPAAENSKADSATQLSYAEELKQRKSRKKVERDNKLLSRDRWIAKSGHTLTYVGIFLFALVVYFRPYEWIPAFSGLTSLAFVIALVTVLIYLPTQLVTEGSLTILTTEVKCILFIAFWALLTMPIAKDPGLAWQTFNETFSKIILIFIVMVNTLRTQKRLKGLMWLSIGIGVMLSWQAIGLYQRGQFAVEGYRVEVDFGGMFGNPNDLALHLVIFTPLAVVFGLASKNWLAKILYFGSAGLMVAANMVTQSRGGFLGLLAISAMMVWKLGKRNRVKIIAIAVVVGAIIITLAPGNYWLRILSIFIPALDPVGSSSQRSELLKQSIQVTLRNPWGIGLGNFPIAGIRNLQTHNAFTQVSSELGVLSLIAYVWFMVSPLRKLAVIERQLFSRADYSWMYYMAIGLQVSIVGYMVSSFFVPVAYQWFIYYPIAYAVCLRRIYKIQQQENGEVPDEEAGLMNYVKPQRS